MSLQEELLRIGNQAVKASRLLAVLDTETKNGLLRAMADEVDARHARIKAENASDLQAAKENGLSSALMDRLELNDERIANISLGIRQIADLPDPVGKTIDTKHPANGLEIRKIRVPIGVIAIIYESRPNVTADAAALCLKSSNAVILRGGREAIHSNRALAAALQEGGQKHGLPANAVQLLQTTDREAVRHLVQLEGLVNLVIPRGGEGLIRTVAEMSRVPVIKHYKGVCHTYVDHDAHLDMALDICENAKCQRPGVCNAMETLLVHVDVATEFLPKLSKRLSPYGVELRGDEASIRIVPAMKPSTEEDWYTEYLDLTLSVKVVEDVRAAVAHINKYGSQHSDAIVTQSDASKAMFTREVDSATVYVNASTRFTDGAEFGMGAEIGISTDKLHARGPMGLEELTTYKYVIMGTGQVRN